MEKNSRTYNVNCHYKQGDDLWHLLQITKDPSKAFGLWASSFSANQKLCEKIAKAINGTKVTVFADTHCITLTSHDDRSLVALQNLADQGLIQEEEEEEEN